MASDADIANWALTKLGSSTKIAALTDNSVEAVAINGVYHRIRRAELRKRHWSFAIKRGSLPALSSAPTWGFDYAYQLPTDYLRMMQVGEYIVVPSLSDYTSQDASPYAIEGQTICTDFTAPLSIRYVGDITDSSLFDDLFVEAFAAKIAYECCEQITQSTGKRQVCSQDYAAAINQAARVGAIEKPPAPILDDSWVIARL